MDESPDQVTLPPGNYYIVAQSSWCGLVTAPVVVDKGNVTVVHLDGDWWRPSRTSTDRLVSLRNGEAAGWSAPISRLSK